MAKTPVGLPPEAAADFAALPKYGNGHAPTDQTATNAIQTLLHSHSRDELMQCLSSQRKALYERVQLLRQAIGKSPLDITENLRELREHA